MPPPFRRAFGGGHAGLDLLDADSRIDGGLTLGLARGGDFDPHPGVRLDGRRGGLRDHQRGRLIRVAVEGIGNGGHGVAFTSGATNLIANDTNDVTDAFFTSVP